MSRLSPARAAALACLSEVRRRDGRMREVLRASEHMARLGPQDRAQASRLALGTTAATGFVDELIDERLRRRSSLEPRVRDALRISSFESCFLSTPPSACVSQGVELVRSVAPRAAGLANALLRRVTTEVRPAVAAARARCLEASWDEVTEGDLVLVSALPRWLVRQLLLDRGTAFARELCLAQLEQAPVYVATNRLRHDEGLLSELMATRGLEPSPVPGLAGSFVVGRPSGLATSGLVDDVDLVVSDLAAQVVARVSAPRSGGCVLEVGQGRGTKTLLMASYLRETGCSASFVGVESQGFKVGIARERLLRAGMAEGCSCVELDGRLLGKEFPDPALDEPFDAVLVDAPCSGTGTMRRHPEIAWSLEPADVGASGELPLLQRELLAAAASCVRSGGTLAYATCSVLRSEDEEAVREFLAGDTGRDFERVDLRRVPAIARLDESGRTLTDPWLRPDGSLLSGPVTGGPDGHFCTLLRRR